MIFKNINSEDISGLIICSEPPISSSAIKTKETTIDGRDGAIVEKLGYKTRIRNVEIGLKKDANVDKILSYFSGEGDLIFKNENDKVYKAAIYEQVDLERLLRLRKGSVAFYCQPFKYKRNDIFETIKDNKVKEKKEEYLELLNCAEQNVVDLKLEGSTTQATRSGKNLLDNTATTKISNGITFTVNSDGTVLADGTNDATANSSLVINRYDLSPGTYILNGCPSGGASNTYRLAIQETGSYSILGSIDIGNGSGEFTIDATTNVQIAIFIQKGLTVNNLLFKPMLRKATIADDTYEQYGASPSPDYPSPIENVEGKNKLDYKTVSNTPNTVVSLIENGFNVNGMYAGKVIVDNLKKNTNYYLQYLTENIAGTLKQVSIFAGDTQTNTLKLFNNSIGGIFNTGENTKINIWFYVNNKPTTTGEANFTNIQLEEGTVATPYVPYDSLEIKNIGENLFDINKRLQGTINSDGDLEISRNVNKFYEYDFKENTQYTFSAYVKNKNENKGNVRFKIVYKDGTENGEVLLNRTTIYEYITYTSALNKTIDYIAINYGNEGIMYIKNGELQIEEGTQATPYKPYQEQKVDFPLSEGQKLYECSYLASDGIHHKRKQYVITGNETIGKIWIDDDTHHVFEIKASLPVPQISDKIYKEYLCNTYRALNYDGGIDSIWANRKDNNTNYTTAMAIDCVNRSLSLSGRIIIKDMSIDDIDKMKTYLSEQYSNGTPVIVEYELATEEIVPYTTAQQEAYNQLQKLKLYKGQNTMFSLEGSIINLKYLEDTDEKVENQGNIYSKPIIRLEKTVFKEVEIAINGIRFKYNFEEDDYVEIDCEEMTVQYEGLDRNRRLVIDFEFPKLKEGNNDIVMYSGDCIIKCKRKDRWL